MAANIRALEGRREYFKTMGATATDHAALTAYTESMSAGEAEAIFQRALKDEATAKDAARFTGHMLVEMGADEQRRWFGDAAACRFLAQSQPADLRALWT